MDPINPWLDADEVRQLAESLLPARNQPAFSINDAGFNEAFVGFTSSAPVIAPAPVIAAAPVIASTPVVAPAPTPAPAPARSASDSSLHAFQASIQQSHRAECLFIIDPAGHAVFGQDHYPQFHFIARSLTQNAGRRGLPKGHIHIKIGPAKTLEIIPLHSPERAWVAGVIVPQPLPAETIAQWAIELARQA